jgi:hypothetical protein
MNRSLRAGAIASALSMMAVTAHADVLRVEGIEGEPAAAPRAIEVQSWSWGVSNQAGSSTSSGAAAGKVSVQDISIMRATDRAGTSAARSAPSATPTVPAAPAPAAATPRSAAVAAADGGAAPREVTVVMPEAAARSLCVRGKHIAKASLEGRERVELANVVVVDCTTQAGTSTVQMRGHTRTGHVTLMK